VNAELMIAFLRQRLTSPIRLAILGLAFVFPLLVAAFVRGAPLEILGANATNFALVFAAGMIGQDVSSGVLQLVFARPVARAEYVYSRWGAAAAAAAALVILQVALFASLGALRGNTHTPNEVALFAAETVIHAVGTVSVMALFSSLVPGLADLALLVMGGFIAAVLGTLGQAVSSLMFLERVGHEIERFTSPQVALMPLLQGGSVSWVAIVSYLSTVTLCLALAIVLVNRKEFSYASAGA
jgi:ABC-type transport system involved in multi-copper enzyme maturation permease subunit